jgi:hypothetical protein
VSLSPSFDRGGAERHAQGLHDPSWRERPRPVRRADLRPTRETQSNESPAGRHDRLRVHGLLPGMRRGSKVLPPVFQPTNRPQKFACYPRNQDLLRVDHIFAPESAAKTGSRRPDSAQANPESSSSPKLHRRPKAAIPGGFFGLGKGSIANYTPVGSRFTRNEFLTASCFHAHPWTGCP